MDAPNTVIKRFNQLKGEYTFGITLANIKGKYYVYRRTSKWDRERKRVKTIAEYLGKITEEGAFIRKIIGYKNELDIARNIITEHGGKVILPKQLEGEIAPFEMNREDLSLLEALSMKSRISLPELGKITSIPHKTLSHKLERLYERYKIRATIEIRPDTFGFTRFLIMVKFTSTEPSEFEVKEILESEPRIQLVALSQGDYSMLIYMIVENIHKLEETLYKIRSNNVFAKHDAIWKVSYLKEPTGWFMPLRDEFFEKLLKEKVWHRRGEKGPGQLFLGEYAVLKEMNKNATIPFSEIDERHSLNRGNSRNTFEKLKANGTIERTTIVLQKLPIKYLSFLYLEQKNIALFNKTRSAYLASTIEETDKPSDKYVYKADASSPYGIVLIAPIYKEGDFEALKEELQQKANGCMIEQAIVTHVILGSFGFRKFKMKETGTYRLVKSLENTNNIQT